MEGPNQNDELYPIAVLIDELKVRLLVVISARCDLDIDETYTA